MFLLPSIFVSAQIEVTNLGVLPASLGENSGLIYYGDKLIAHNDSGNEPFLFEIDTVSLAITRTVEISNVENNDWEDLAQDDQYIYVGDFGNNQGTRTDLAIYRIPKLEYDFSESLLAERIDFAYEDQVSFEDQGSSDWDAEALIMLNGQLIVLTKQWKSLKTVAYTIPNTPGNHIAQRVGEFDCNGLVTGACFIEDTDELYILGHSTLLEPFVYKVTEPLNQDVFQGESTKLDVNLGFGQTEGIAYIGDNRFFISSESFTREVPAITLSAQLLAMQLPVEVVEIPEEEEEEETVNEDFLFSVYPDSEPDKMAYDLIAENKVLARAVFSITGKMILFEVDSEFTGNSFDITTLNSGIYFLVLYVDDKVVSKPFYKN